MSETLLIQSILVVFVYVSTWGLVLFIRERPYETPIALAIAMITAILGIPIALINSIEYAVPYFIPIVLYTVAAGICKLYERWGM